MTQVITWLAVTGIVFFVSVVCFFLSVIRKKLILLYISIFLLFSGCCTGAYTVYVLFSKTRNRITDYYKPRSGSEIYKALFGEPVNNCVQVKNYRDQIVPRLDCCIWLGFNTCPAELRRILKKRKYESTRKASNELSLSGTAGNEKPEWWKPEVLGDTIIVMHDEEPNRWIIFYISKDSSKVFYNDMAD